MRQDAARRALLIGLSPDGARVSGDGRVRGPRPARPARTASGARSAAREIGLVFQEPAAALDPVRTIGDADRRGDPAARAASGVARPARRAVDRPREVSFPDPERRLDEYPHRLSGGHAAARLPRASRSRPDPRLLVADEPTASLDATVAARRSCDLLDRLRRERGLARPAHHATTSGSSRAHCDRALVLYAGAIVEEGAVGRALRGPAHPYTRGLLGRAAAPRRRAPAGRRGSETIPGAVPDLSARRARAAPSRRAARSVSSRATAPRARRSIRAAAASGALLPVRAGAGRAATRERSDAGRRCSRRPDSSKRYTSAGRPLRAARGRCPRRRRASLRDRAAARRSGSSGSPAAARRRSAGIVARLEDPDAGDDRASTARTGSRSPARRCAGAGATSRSSSRIRTTSLNPRLRVGDQIAEPLRVQRLALGRATLGRRVSRRSSPTSASPAAAAERFPSELSGGQRQRVAIARALATGPEAASSATSPCRRSTSRSRRRSSTCSLDLRERVRPLVPLHLARSRRRRARRGPHRGHVSRARSSRRARRRGRGRAARCIPTRRRSRLAAAADPASAGAASLAGEPPSRVDSASGLRLPSAVPDRAAALRARRRPRSARRPAAGAPVRRAFIPGERPGDMKGAFRKLSAPSDAA